MTVEFCTFTGRASKEIANSFEELPQAICKAARDALTVVGKEAHR